MGRCIRSLVLGAECFRDRVKVVESAALARDLIRKHFEVEGIMTLGGADGAKLALPIDLQLLVVVCDPLLDGEPKPPYEGLQAIHVGPLEDWDFLQAWRIGESYPVDGLERIPLVPICSLSEWLVRHRVHHPKTLDQEDLDSYQLWAVSGKKPWEAVDEV